ncbi:MAG: hypothetical protein KF747_04455 [Nitrospira sp.]|nr:hypothetical protein [Nitrospira sp.]
MVKDRFTASFMGLHPLRPLKMSCEAAKKRAEPYNKIVGEHPEMRQDTLDLVRIPVRHNRQAHALINNRSAGTTLMKIRAMITAFLDSTVLQDSFRLRHMRLLESIVEE